MICDEILGQGFTVIVILQQCEKKSSYSQLLPFSQYKICFFFYLKTDSQKYNQTPPPNN